MAEEPDQYDIPWKDAVERHFPEFMEFFFPDAHREIDWEKPHRSRDKELHQIVRDAEQGKRYVDKLVEVACRGGGEEWVYVHVEVQGSPKADFARRMFTYNYRIFDRFTRPVASLAVLADQSPDWRTSSYGYDLFGCQMKLNFPVAKLLDYEEEKKMPYVTRIERRARKEDHQKGWEEGRVEGRRRRPLACCAAN